MQEKLGTNEKLFRYQKRFGEGGASGALLILMLVALFLVSIVPSTIESSSYGSAALLAISFVTIAIATFISMQNRLVDIVISESGISSYSGKKMRRKMLWSKVINITYGLAVGGRAAPIYRLTTSIIDYLEKMKEAFYLRSNSMILFRGFRS